MKSTMFLGGGRITGALLAGLRLAKNKTPILVHDRNEHKLRALEREYGVAVETNLGRAIARADRLIVAVRPDSVSEVLKQVREWRVSNAGKRNRAVPVLACSLAAGVPLWQLRAQLGRPVLWCRAMPSPAARSGRGLTALTFDRGFPKAWRGRMMKFFGQVGPVLEIPERKFDAFMVTFSPSHGYHALATMAQAAQNLGLKRQAAFTAAAHALADAIASWREGDESLEELLREAATPGGIAAAVMKTMDSAGYSRMVERALRAGIKRSERIAKSS
ncbi:MAG TPA: pyrroline-5-carboxylate reductase dimerization domain-containing protein [Terriglobales bacterium]|nr:pyrroline-5-carboxylate reductase dimerization domain-containing protein [Terriglobales bacterium]